MKRMFNKIIIMIIFASVISLIFSLPILLNVLFGRESLSEKLYYFTAFAIIVFIAALILLLRDTYRYYSRPIDERIEDIRKEASSFISEFPELRETFTKICPEKEKLFEPLLEFYKKLELLAASPQTSAQDAIELGKDADIYIRENKLKGFYPDDSAYTLADLIKRREDKIKNKGKRSRNFR